MTPGPLTLRETAWTLELDCATADVLRALDEAGISAIVLKGPALAELLYADGAPRAYFDSDILVRERDMPAARAVMEGTGYTLDLSLSERTTAYDESWKRDWHLVELHVGLSEVGVSPDDLWAAVEPDTRPLQVAGYPARTLGPAATAMLLALHVARHGHHFGGKPLEDLRRGIKALPYATWQAAAELARRLHAHRAFGWGLGQAPGGSELAARLGVEVSASRRLLLQQQDRPLVAQGLEELASVSSASARLRWLRERLFPSALFMRRYYGAQRGAASLARAHARRAQLLARSAPTGIRSFVHATPPGSRVRRAWVLARSVRMGVRLGRSARADLHALDAHYYSGGANATIDYASMEHNRGGLFDWESNAIGTHFPRRGRVLVVAAGGGREVLALARAGYEVDGYECHPALVAAANRLLEAEGVAARVLPVARDAAPDTGRRCSALIVGWVAYTLIPGRAARVKFLRDLRDLAESGAPVLLSWAARKDEVPVDYEVVRRVGGLLRRLRRDESIELGDTLEENFAHRFTLGELVAELAEAGWRVCSSTVDGDAHTVATAAARE